MGKVITAKKVNAFVEVFYAATLEFGLVNVKKKLNEMLVPAEIKTHTEDIKKNIILREINSVYSLFETPHKCKKMHNVSSYQKTAAIALSILFVKKHLAYPQSKICSVLEIDKSVVSKVISCFEKVLNGSIIDYTMAYSKVFDTVFLENYKKIDKKITIIFTSLNS